MKKLLVLFALIMPVSIAGSPIKPPKHKVKESLENRLSRTLLTLAKSLIVSMNKDEDKTTLPEIEVINNITHYHVHSKNKITNITGHDIIHTNSIVSPYTGTVAAYSQTFDPEHFMLDTLEEVKHLKYNSTPTETFDITFVFAYQHGKWVFKTLETTKHTD